MLEHSILGHSKIVAFLPTTDTERAISFFRDILGLNVVNKDEFAVVFEQGGVRLRVTKVEALQPYPFTVLGWQVKGIEQIMTALVKKGVRFERYDFLTQDELGIWTAPGGIKVGWFKDPDGNLLSLSQ